MVDISAAQFMQSRYRTPLVAAIGDSRVEHDIGNYLVTTGSIPQINDTVGPAVGKVAGHSTLGILSWLQAISFGQIRAPIYDTQTATTPGTQVAWSPNYNQAVGGAVSAALSYQIDRLLSQSPLPTHCVILSGYNDIVGSVTDNASATTTLEALKSNLISAWQRLLLAGIQPITIVDLPANWNSNTYRSKCHAAYRQWQRTAANIYGSWFVDAASDLADISSSVGSPLAAMYATDTPLVHPGPRGALAIAQKLLGVFAAKGALNAPNYGQSLQDTYDATLHPTGNLVPTAGLMTGTSGTFNGSNAPTGQAPSGWQGRNNNGGTGGIVSSVQARANGQGQDWKIVITAATDTEFWGYCDLTNVTVGDIVSGAIEVNVDASTNLDRINIYLNELDSTGATTEQQCGAMLGAQASSSGLMPTSFGGRFATEKMLLSTTGCKVRIAVSAYVTAGGSATMRIGAAEVRKS